MGVRVLERVELGTCSCSNSGPGKLLGHVSLAVGVLGLGGLMRACSASLHVESCWSSFLGGGEGTQIHLLDNIGTLQNLEQALTEP